MSAPREIRLESELRGRISDLLVVRLHGRARGFASLPEAARASLVEACVREATVPDLAARILARSVYAQSSGRTAPLRELVQNALDATPPGGLVELSLSPDGRELVVRDRGPGMSRASLVEDLLVPFRSTKEARDEAIGEHGVGFFSALELAPEIEVTTTSRAGSFRLSISPVGEGPPHPDFEFRLRRLAAGARAAAAETGTSVKLRLREPAPRAAISAELAAAAGLVPPTRARILFDGALVNGLRSAYRRVARATIEGGLGELELSVGRGEGVPPQLALVQGGLHVALRHDPFPGHASALHREIARAMTSAGFGLLVDLPRRVPLNKGRSAVAASAAGAVETAIVFAFERFVLEDALRSRELLRAADHRLGGVLDRLLGAALAGESAPAPAAAPLEVEAPRSARDPEALGAPSPISTRLERRAGPARADRGPRPGAADRPRAVTVAASEEVVRFAAALLEAPLFSTATFGPEREEQRRRATLRELLAFRQRGQLRALGDPASPRSVHLVVDDPLSSALWRRLCEEASPFPGAGGARQGPPSSRPGTQMGRISRKEVLALGRRLPGAPALAAVMLLVEHVDAAISEASALGPSPITVHQNLYGLDEMAHTDGSGISLNFGSPRVRALFARMLEVRDPLAFGAMVDLVLHEKTHVSLASYAPRPNAEHGASFYRRKEQLRRRLLEALAGRRIVDPAAWLPVLQRTLPGPTLPSPERLAAMLAPPAEEAA